MPINISGSHGTTEVSGGAGGMAVSGTQGETVFMNTGIGSGSSEQCLTLSASAWPIYHTASAMDAHSPCFGQMLVEKTSGATQSMVLYVYLSSAFGPQYIPITGTLTSKTGRITAKGTNNI